MNILFLGPCNSRIYQWLNDRESTDQTAHILLPGSPGSYMVARSHKIISHGYRHIVPKWALDAVGGRAVNCHISLLPHNRGADPNFWSWVDDTPKGVTIHQMTEEVDAGDYYASLEVEGLAGDSDTLRSTYKKLQACLLGVFTAMWPKLREQSVAAEPQPEGGSYHRHADMLAHPILKSPLWRGWDTPISVLDSWAAETQMAEEANAKIRREIQ